MSKKTIKETPAAKPLDFESEIMDKVRSKQIAMRPKWYFVAGSLLTLIGVVSATLSAIFLTGVTFFALRGHGMMAQWRLNTLVESFPLWLPVLAVAATLAGLWLLRQYNFSYKNNFVLIILGFVAAIVLAGFAFDVLGFNEAWSERPHMRGFYRQIQQEQGTDWQPGSGQMRRNRR